MRESYCPNPLYGRAKLYIEGIIDGASKTRKNTLLEVVEEEEGGLTASGRFEKLVMSGPDSGLYLEGLQIPLRFPMSILPLADPEKRPGAPTGLEIVREGIWTSPRPFRAPRRTGWTEVQSINRGL